MRLFLLLSCLAAILCLVAAAPCATKDDALDLFFKYGDTDGDARVSSEEFLTGVATYVKWDKRYAMERLGGVEKVFADCASGQDNSLTREYILAHFEQCMKPIYHLVDCPI